MIRFLFLASLTFAACVKGRHKPHDEPRGAGDKIPEEQDDTQVAVVSDERLHELYNSAFNLYLPELHEYGPEFEKNRVAAREASWLAVKDYSRLRFLLSVLDTAKQRGWAPDDLEENFPNIYQQGFDKVSREEQLAFLLYLRRHPSNKVRKFAYHFRSAFTLLAFSTPLTNTISNMPISPPQPKASDFRLPPTSLVLKDGVIAHTEGPIDYLVVGSGPAGSLITHELARKHPQAKIVIVEAGSFVKPGSFKTEFQMALMESFNLRTNVEGGIILRNGRAVGGGSAVNVDLAFSPDSPAIRRRLDQWIREGWVDPSTFSQEKVRKAYAWVTDKIGTRSVNQSEINANNLILWRGAKKVGLEPATYHLNARKPTGSSDEILKISAVDAFLGDALLGKLGRAVNIVPDASVIRVLTESGTPLNATGVEIQFNKTWEQDFVIQNPNGFPVRPGDLATIRAKHIIISAGALGSPGILLRSHIPNDHIGKGIVIHPSMGFPGIFQHEINMLAGLSASVYVPSKPIEDGYFFESMAAEPSFGALAHPGTPDQILDLIRKFRYVGGFGIMLVDEPADGNRVFIDETTGNLEVSYSLSTGDTERMKKGIRQGLEMLFEEGAQRILLPTSEPILSADLEYHAIESRDQLDEVMRHLTLAQNQNFTSSAHIQASNKMGGNPDTSVVSHHFRVWDKNAKLEIPNLYVVDGSIFPTSCGANPMQTIYTVAKLFADSL